LISDGGNIGLRLGVAVKSARFEIMGDLDITGSLGHKSADFACEKQLAAAAINTRRRLRFTIGR